MKLLIIGNGFDIHHGYKTQYAEYRNYLKMKATYVLERFESFPWFNQNSKSNLWADIEKSLSVDFGKMMGLLNQYLADYHNGDDDALCKLKTDLENYTRFIYQFTGESFYKWLSSIDLALGAKDEKLSGLLANAIFINFNYTNSLECLYNIPSDRILFIHGKLVNVRADNCLSRSVLPSFSTIEEAEFYDRPIIESDKFNSEIVRSEIQFGAPSDDKPDNSLEDFYAKCEDPDICSLIKEFVDRTTKKCSNNSKKLREFLKSKEITEVTILGLSLSGGDICYFEEVLIPKYSNCLWNFYYHGDEDLTQKKEFAQNHSITLCRFIEW